jgi:rhodanese-related sulfurtransferase
MNFLQQLFGGVEGYKRIAPQEAKAKLAEKAATLVDVRTAGEFRGRRIPGSVNISVDAIGREAARQLPRKDAPIIVYCASGGRSRAAAQTLLGLGYTDVSDLGGIMSWPFETVSG